MTEHQVVAKSPENSIRYALDYLERIAKALEEQGEREKVYFDHVSKPPFVFPASNDSLNDPVKCDHFWVQDASGTYCKHCNKEHK